jgi:hypothetical protein
MSRLRTPVAVIEMALNARGEGLGVRAAGRVVKKSASQVSVWEEKLSKHLLNYSPPAPEGGEVILMPADRAASPDSSDKFWHSAKARPSLRNILTMTSVCPMLQRQYPTQSIARKQNRQHFVLSHEWFLFDKNAIISTEF